MRARTSGFGTSARRDVPSHPHIHGIVAPGPGRYHVWSSHDNCSPYDALSGLDKGRTAVVAPTPHDVASRRTAGLATEARRAVMHRDHDARNLASRHVNMHTDGVVGDESQRAIARAAKQLNKYGSVPMHSIADLNGGQSVGPATDGADLRRARDEFERLAPSDDAELRGTGSEWERRRSSPAAASGWAGRSSGGYEPYSSEPHGAPTYPYDPYASYAPPPPPRPTAAAAGVYDPDLVYEQARRDTLRGTGPAPYAPPDGGGRRPRSPVLARPASASVVGWHDSPSPAHPPPPRTPDPRPSGWVEHRLGSSAARRGARALGRSDTERDWELRAWYLTPHLGGVSSQQVDALEGSLRKLVEQLEVTAGNRTKAMRRLFADFPSGARALYDGGISASEFESMLVHLRVQWATAATARALFERYDFDGSTLLSAPELEAMLFRASEGSRARVAIGRVREALAARGASGLKEMKDTIKQFRVFDADGSSYIDRDEFRRGMSICLRGTDIWPLSRQDEEALFKTFDHNGDGKIAFEEFARTVRNPMAGERRAAVLRAYDGLCARLGADPRVGIVLADIGREYDASMHPDVQSGRATRDEVLRAYLDGFNKNEDELVTLDEFVEYYTWLNWCVEDDKAFLDMVYHSLNPEDSRWGPRRGAGREVR